MFRALSARQIGKLPPRMHTAETLRNEYAKIELKETTEIVSHGMSPISSLDIDLVEGRYLLAASGNDLALYDVAGKDEGKKQPLSTGKWGPGHTGAITSVVWYPLDTGMFHTAGVDGLVKVWDANRLEAVQDFALDTSVHVVTMSSVATSHSLIACGTRSQQIRMCDLRSGACTHSLSGHRGEIWALRWFPFNEYLIASGSTDMAIRFWDIRRPGSLKVLDQHNKSRPDQRYFSAADGLRAARTESHGGAITQLQFTDTGRWLLSSGTDRRLRLWSSDTGKNTLVHYAGATNGAKHCDFAQPKGSGLVFYSMDRKVQVLGLHTGRLLRTLKGHIEDVTCMVAHPHRPEIYTGGQESAVLAWGTRSQTAEQERDEWSASEGEEEEEEDERWHRPGQRGGTYSGAEALRSVMASLRERENRTEGKQQQQHAREQEQPEGGEKEGTEEPQQKRRKPFSEGWVGCLPGSQFK